MEKIKDKDIKALQTLIKEKGVKEESVLKRYGIKSFKEMTFGDFNKAMTILKEQA